MSSVRINTRADGTITTSILFREFDATKDKRVQASVTFEDHEAALAWRKVLDKTGPEQARKILAVEQRAPQTKITTLNDDFAETYIQSLTGVLGATRDRYRAYMRNDIGPYMGDLPLAALCAADAEQNSVVQEWVSALEMDGEAGKTIANKHGFLSATLRTAVKRRLLPFNPCEDTRLPPRHYEPCFLEPEEFDVLYAAVPLRWQPMVFFLVTTGVRYSECTALHVRDLREHLERDESTWTCRVARAWKYTGTGEQLLGATKTKKGTRTINVPNETIERLGLKNRAAGELLFPTQSGGRISSQLFHNKCWRPMMATLKYQLGKHPRPHDLRHTCASWMLNHGAELTDVQGHLGHEKITTTVDVYGHLDRRSGRRASLAVSKALGG